MAGVNLFNQTLHKQALQRRKQIRALLTNGRTHQSVAKQLGVTRQRVQQLAPRKPKRNRGNGK